MDESQNKTNTKSSKIVLIIAAVVILAVIVFVVVQSQLGKKQSLPLTAANLAGTWVGEAKDDVRLHLYFEEDGDVYLTEYEGDAELPSSAHLITDEQYVIGEGTLQFSYKYDLESHNETYAATLTDDTLQLAQTGDTPLRLTGTYQKAKETTDDISSVLSSGTAESTLSSTTELVSSEAESSEAESSEPPPSEPPPVSSTTEPTEQDDDAWRNAYLSCINVINAGKIFSHCLIYVDADDIPELFLGDQYTGYLCSFADGQVRTIKVSLEQIYFMADGSGLCYTRNGGEDAYSDEVYKLENGYFTPVFHGEYSEDSEYAEAGKGVYDLNGVMTPEFEYKQKLNDAFDITKATKIDPYYTYEEMVEILTNWR